MTATTRAARAITAVVALVTSIGLARVAALAADGPDRVGSHASQNPARAAGIPAVPVERLAVLGKDAAALTTKPWTQPQDAWEHAWAHGRTFTPVPPLPTLPPDTAATLALARLTKQATVDHDDVTAAARRLGIPAPPRLDAATLDAVLAAARRIAAPVLLAAGVDVGQAVDPADLLRAATALGVDVGSVAGTDDVHRVLDEARATASPLLWASGHDPGTVLDAGDLAAAAARLGLVAEGVAPVDDLRRLAASRLTRVDRSHPMPGVDHATWRVDLGGDHAVAHVLRWRLDDERVVLTTQAAGGLDGLASVPSLAAALDDATPDDGPLQPRIVANGGFWMGSGEPDGLLVHQGDLLSDPATRRSWVRGIRGGFGVDGDRAVVGRPTWLGKVVAEDLVLELHGINRDLDLDGDVVAFTPEWGTTTGTPPGTVEVVLPDVRLAQLSLVDTVVAGVSTDGDAAIPHGGVVLAAHGRSAPALQALAQGQAVRVTAETTPAWQDLDEGLGAGPLLLADGQPTQREDWHTEGFGDGHNLRRHPRTAIGFTPDGEALLLVVDGRRPGHSVGLTTPETIRLLRSFGVTDAVMLDGGGSSHLVVDRQTANRPCCDHAPRSVSTGLVLWQAISTP